MLRNCAFGKFGTRLGFLGKEKRELNAFQITLCYGAEGVDFIPFSW